MAARGQPPVDSTVQENPEEDQMGGMTMDAALAPATEPPQSSSAVPEHSHRSAGMDPMERELADGMARNEALLPTRHPDQRFWKC